MFSIKSDKPVFIVLCSNSTDFANNWGEKFIRGRKDKKNWLYLSEELYMGFHGELYPFLDLNNNYMASEETKDGETLSDYIHKDIGTSVNRKKNIIYFAKENIYAEHRQYILSLVPTNEYHKIGVKIDSIKEKENNPLNVSLSGQQKTRKRLGGNLFTGSLPLLKEGFDEVYYYPDE